MFNYNLIKFNQIQLSILTINLNLQISPDFVVKFSRFSPDFKWIRQGDQDDLSHVLYPLILWM